LSDTGKVSEYNGAVHHLITDFEKAL